MNVDVQQEQCILIKFLVVEGVSGAEIHRRLLAVFKSEILSRSRVFEWSARFCSGHQGFDLMGSEACLLHFCYARYRENSTESKRQLPRNFS